MKVDAADRVPPKVATSRTAACAVGAARSSAAARAVAESKDWRVKAVWRARGDRFAKITIWSFFGTMSLAARSRPRPAIVSKFDANSGSVDPSISYGGAFERV